MIRNRNKFIIFAVVFFSFCKEFVFLRGRGFNAEVVVVRRTFPASGFQSRNGKDEKRINPGFLRYWFNKRKKLIIKQTIR